MLLYRVPWLLSLYFVGSIGSKELAAAALATTLCNVTGMSLSVGLGSAITTLTGQARGQLLARGEEMKKIVGTGSNNFLSDETTPLTNNGSRKHGTGTDNAPILPLVYLYRGIFIQLAFVLPVGCYWLHGVKPILLYLGQGEQLSTMTQTYLQILAPGLWGYSLNFTLLCWLQVVELAHVPAYAAAFGLILHVPMNLFFIHHLGWLGVGVATTMFQIIQPISIFVYLKGTAHGKAQLLECIGAKGIGRTHLSFWCEAKAAISSISGILQYLALALPGILTISEWWASETCIFLAGKLSPNPESALGAMAIYQSLNSSCFMFPYGMSIAGSARIGSQLGSGSSEGARLSARVCVTMAGLLSATLGLILYLTPHSAFPALFTSDVELIDMMGRVIPLLAIYIVGDGLQVALGSIIKGTGRQCVLVPIVLVAYWCIAMPLAWHLVFVKGGGATYCELNSFCGVVGLVAALTVGTWVHFGLLAIYCACMIDWRLEAKLAEERLSLENEVNDNNVLDDEGTSTIHLNITSVL